MKDFFKGVLIGACSLFVGLAIGYLITYTSDRITKNRQADFIITGPQAPITSVLSLKSDFTIDPVQMIAMDKEYVYNFADSVRKANKDTLVVTSHFFECQVELSGELDTLVKCTPVSVTNIFQVNKTNPKTLNFDADVFAFVREAIGTSYILHGEHKHWGGDNDMIDFPLYVGLNQAFDNLNKVNYKKPNSRFVTLRSMVGPYPANPQWVFGNDNRGTIFVDVVTGKVTDKNPATTPVPNK